MNPIKTVARDDVNLYLKLGRQPVGKPLVSVYFYNVKCQGQWWAAGSGGIAESPSGGLREAAASGGQGIHLG